MGFTSANLTGGGRTARYQFSYDDTFSAIDGWQRTSQVMAACDDDFTLMQSWFAGVGFGFSLPMNVQIANATGGASWQDPPDITKNVGFTPTVTINPGTGATPNFIRFLLVAEVVEMFMASQGDTWFESTSLFFGADEGSKGEGLSRFLSVQLLLTRGIAEHFGGFDVTKFWMNAPGRPNFVDSNPDDNQPDVTTGCTAAFIWFLHSQLGFSIPQIIAAGSGTLGGVFQNLTGKTGGFAAFSTLVNTFYPPGITYHPLTDAIFPVPHLSSLQDVQINSGDSQNERILTLDSTALAEVVVSLSSDNPSVLSVPSQVTLQPGTWATGINLSAAAVTGPTQTVAIHASYAGTRLSANVTIVPRSSLLEGRVTDTAMNPIADATIELFASSPITQVTGNTMQLSTDANGFYQAPAITPQFYDVQAIKSGYVTGDAKITVGLGTPVTTQNFMLAKSLAFTVKGIVSAQGGAAGLAGAAVRLAINSPVPGNLTTVTDINGSYSFNYNPGSYAGDYTLGATLAGYEPATVTFTVTNGATLVENLVLLALGAVSGTVRDTGGAAIATATVAVGTISAHTSAGGVYSLAGLTPGANLVAANAPGFDGVQVQVMISPGAHVVHDIALTTASASVTGTVTRADSGDTISGEQVAILGAGTAVTAADGTYTVTHVPSGNLQATASAHLLKPQTVSVHVIVAQVLEQDFALAPIHPVPPPRGGTGQPM